VPGGGGKGKVNETGGLKKTIESSTRFRRGWEKSDFNWGGCENLHMARGGGGL